MRAAESLGRREKNQEKKGGVSLTEAWQEKLRIVQETLGEVAGSSPNHPPAPLPSNTEVVTGFPLAVTTLKTFSQDKITTYQKKSL